MGDLNKLKSAFQADNFNVSDDNILIYQGRIGIMAEHNTAVNSVTGLPKKAFYVEGSHYEMGYLLGYLAEEEISVMATDFADHIVTSFINDDQEPEIIKVIEGWLGDIILDYARNRTKHDHAIVPPEFDEEMNGIIDGCKMANNGTKVTKERLLMINFGHDILCSIIYTGNLLCAGLNEPLPGIKAEHFKIPMMCNGFSVFGKSAGGGHYMGRDFMFPTAGVYQNVACLIINNPIDVISENGVKALPTVNMSAPGLVGSPTSMNSLGIGCGVQIVASGNCTPDSIGINSLLLVRYAMQFADSARNAVSIMASLPKGVSWLYLIGDGMTDKACVVESGASNIKTNFLFYTNPHDKNKDLSEQLPDIEFIKSHKTADWQNGLMVRWSDYKYNMDYLTFNDMLLSWYNRKWPEKPLKNYNATAFNDDGYIDNNLKEKNCPRTYYFTPLRTSNGEYVLVTNDYIIPEMRLAMMWEWSAAINNMKSSGIAKTDDIQWRFDKLNQLFIDALAGGGIIDYQKAKDLANYLSPKDNKFDNDCAGYTAISHNPEDVDSDGKPHMRIEGSTSLLDLKKKTIEARYGYYDDQWVKIGLLNYI